MHYYNYYNFVYSLPDKQDIGGVGIYYNKSIVVKDITLNQIKDDGCESITIIYKKYKYKHVLTGVYRHPGQNIENFQRKLEDYLTSVNQNSKNHIIMGDLNINLLEKEIKSIKYCDSIQTSDMEIVSTLPTRITKKSLSIIDHTYISSNLMDKMNRIYCGNIKETFTDHLPNFLLYYNKPTSDNRPMTRIMSNKNYKIFAQKINETHWDSIINTEDIDWQFETFINRIKNCYEEAFPLVKMSRKSFKDKTWITFDIKKMVKFKNALYANWKNNTDNKELRLAYENSANQLRIEIKKAKFKYYEEIFRSKNKNTKDYWKSINELLGNIKTQGSTISEIKQEGKIFTKSKDIADILNMHYTEIADKTRNKMRMMESVKGIDTNLNSAYSDTINSIYTNNSMNYNSMLLMETTTAEVSNIISKLKNKNSKDKDGLSNKIIKYIQKDIAEILKVLINTAMRKGVFPQSLKVAKIIPIYKGKEKNNVDNYRPISITSIISKIFEKIIKIRLLDFLNKYKLMNENQYGFRQKSNTLYAIMDILNQVYKAIDNSEVVSIVFLDLSKAFDLVNHKLLLDKLKKLGIRGIVNKWFESYLTNRQQYVQILDKKSETKQVKDGVPQGSVLGPILYNIYINDFNNNNNINNRVKFFADDTVYVDYDKDPNKLEYRVNENLEKINNYYISNKLAINYDKTNYMIINTNKTIKYDNFKIKMGGEIINEVDKYKYLGIMIDNRLSWKDHIKNNINKVKKFISVLYKFRQFLPYNILKNITEVTIKPVIFYGIEIFASKNTMELKRLQRLIDKIKKITDNNDSKSKHEITDNITIYARYKYCKLIYNILYDDKLPLNIKKIYKGKIEVHNKGTRKTKNLHVNQLRTSMVKSSFLHQGLVEWNNLPREIQEIENCAKFTSMLKQYYYNKISKDY